MRLDIGVGSLPSLLGAVRWVAVRRGLHESRLGTSRRRPRRLVSSPLSIVTLSRTLSPAKHAKEVQYCEDDEIQLCTLADGRSDHSRTYAGGGVYVGEADEPAVSG